MPTNTIINYFIEEKDDCYKFIIHRMGTSHRESIERFVLNEDKYKLGVEQRGVNEYKTKMLINPKKNNNYRSSITIKQYIKILFFYGLIDCTNFSDDENVFKKMNSEIMDKSLSIEIDIWNKETFKKTIKYIPGNILNQINSKNDSIRKNALTFLSLLWLFNEFKSRGKQINQENLFSIMNEFLGEEKWELIGKSGTKIKVESLLEELNSFNNNPFDIKNFYTDIFRKINF